MKARPDPSRETAAEAELGDEVSYQNRVRADLRRNYAAHLVHGLLGQTGFRLLNAPTFIPAYLYLLSGSDLAVGMGRSLQGLGMSLSPILGAALIEHRRRVLPAGFAVGGVMRLQVLGIAVAGMLLPSDRWTLYAVWGLLGLFGFFLGMQSVIFNFLMSKVIPVERRGLLLGLRNFLAGITASLVAWAGGRYLVEPNVLGNGYSVTFLLAFGLTALGLLALLAIREPEPPRVREASRLLDRLRELPSLLRSDRSYTRYFIARALAVMGRMAVPFYVLYAGSSIGISGVNLAILTPCFLLANTLTNLLWGWIADRTGFRSVFLASLGVWILSVLVLMGSTHLESFALSFVGIGAGLGGFMMSAQNMVLEFGTREDLPMRIAVANSASELVGATGPLLGGLLAALGSYVLVFWVAVVFQAAAMGVVLFFVDEPRRRVRQNTL